MAGGPAQPGRWRCSAGPCGVRQPGSVKQTVVETTGSVRAVSCNGSDGDIVCALDNTHPPSTSLAVFPTVCSSTTTTLNFTDLGSPFASGGGGGSGSGGGSGGGSNTPTPTGSMAAADALDNHHSHHHHLGSGGGLPPTSHQDSTSSSNSTTTAGAGGGSKSAFIELQQHAGVAYNPIRAAAYHHPAAHHFNQGGPQPGGGPPSHHHSAVDPAGFGSPRTALGAYPFPPMHQNTYTGYHLGSYAPQCPSPPKDGEYK